MSVVPLRIRWTSNDAAIVAKPNGQRLRMLPGVPTLRGQHYCIRAIAQIRYWNQSLRASTPLSGEGVLVLAGVLNNVKVHRQLEVRSQLRTIWIQNGKSARLRKRRLSFRYSSISIFGREETNV